MNRLLPLLLLGCFEREYQVHTLPTAAGDLRLTGRICHPLTGIWLENALVYTHLYDDQDMVYDSRSDYTDAGGRFELINLVADRPYEIYVQVGQEVIDRFVVELGDQDLEVPAPVCAEDTALDVAVVTGAWDSLAPVLEALGLGEVQRIDGQAGTELADFLTDPLAMSQFDLVVFDGGHREDGVLYGTGPTEAVRDALRSYVQQGGVIFASDWAYDVLEAGWPEAVDFFGDDAVPDAAQVGEVAQIEASVVDAALASALSTETLALTYDLPVWPVVEAVSPSVEVLLRGDAPWRHGLQTGRVPDAPLLLTFPSGEGQVALSTYRNTSNDAPAVRALLALLVEDLTRQP